MIAGNTKYKILKRFYVKTTKKIIKYTLIFLVIVFNTLIIARLYTFSYYPSSMKKFIWNDAAAAVYSSDAESVVYTADPAMEYDLPKSSNFFCNYLMLVPEANQLQITLRANKSLPEKIKNVYSLESIPTYDELNFDFTLVDNNGNRYPVSIKKQDTAFMYYYERLVFDSIPFDDITALYLDVYIGENPDYEEKSFTSLYVYDEQIPKEEYKLSQDELK